jgi:hypothetical protein
VGIPRVTVSLFHFLFIYTGRRGIGLAKKHNLCDGNIYTSVKAIGDFFATCSY